MSKDTGSAKTAALPPLRVDPTAIISEKATITGSHLVTIGANTVLHPYAKIDSTCGPVTLGAYCMVAERATLGLPAGEQTGGAICLEDYVTIETGATVQAATIGTGSIVGAGASLQPDAHIGQFCKVAPLCTIARQQHIPDFSFVYTAGRIVHDRTTAERAEIQQLKMKGQAMHVDTLRKLIPTNIARWQS